MKKSNQNQALNIAIATVLRTKEVQFTIDNLTKTQRIAIELVLSNNLEVISGNNWSEQGFLAVKNPDNGRWIVVSKDMNGRTALFGCGFETIETNLPYKDFVKVFDFVGYLTKVQYEKPRRFVSKTKQYKRMKSRVERQRNYLDSILKDIEVQEKKLERLREESIQEWKDVIDLEERMNRLFKSKKGD